MQNWVLYVFCLEILCFSGGQRFYVEHNLTFLLIWLVTCVAVFIKKEYDYGTDIVEWFHGACPIILLICWTLLSTIVVNQVVDFSFLSYIIFPLGMILALSYFDFYQLRQCLLKLLSYLLGVSILVHIGYNIDLVPAELIDDGEKVIAMSLYFFNVGWGEIESVSITRFSSIYWEPGQCQIVIMYVLVLFSDDIQSHIYDILYLLKKYGVLLIAILLTGSTTGYIVFALFISGLLLFNMSLLSQKRIMPFFIAVILSFCILSLFYFSDVVQSKFAQGESISDDNSFAIRMADNLACFTVAIEHPLFGLGVSSFELNAELSTYGNTTASNGWLFSAAQMGFVYIAIMFVAMYINVERMKFKLLTGIPLLILILSQANEYATFFPLMWLYCCPFGTYDDNDIPTSGTVLSEC